MTVQARPSAVFSPCRIYRYALWREWDMMKQSYCLFIGLNPSTADEIHDDPTIRRCVDFSKRWGFGALCMANLFAFRATYPSDMLASPAPVGPECDSWLQSLAASADLIIAAWGKDGGHRDRDAEVMRLIPRMFCLGRTKDGNPRHPLYLKKTLCPEPFP